LSVAEAKKYLGGENKQVKGVWRTDERCAQGTEFAKSKEKVYDGGGVKLWNWEKPDKGYEWAKGNSQWWLRTPVGGGGGRFAAYVDFHGYFYDGDVYDFVFSDCRGVRPCVRVRF
jgi:hypothetical protein